MREVEGTSLRGAGGADSSGGNGAVLTLSGIGKEFGATRALDDVSVLIQPGSVVALFGENGAGKSTLLSILAGAQASDAGTIELDGRAYAPRSPREALANGIALVAQELSPCRSLTVAENVVIGTWPASRTVTGRREMKRRVQVLLDRFGVQLPLDRKLGELPVGDAQLVEILRVLNRQPRVVLLDEPTAALSAAEAQLVLKLIRRLAAEGVTVILVTHRVQEALDVADRALVLRSGKLVLDAPRSAVSSDRIVEEMLGRALRPREDHASPRAASPGGGLSLSNWSKQGSEPLRDLSFEVPPGAVVGLYGVRGSGIESVAGGLAGTSRIESGSTTVAGTTSAGAFSSPKAREAAGVRYVPSDRGQAGLALSLSVATNILFALDDDAISRGILRRPAAEKSAVRAIVDEYKISLVRPSQLTLELSGGNQQKVLIASRLQGTFAAFVAHEPTRGIDLGAREAVHQALRRAAAGGRAVLVISSDVDELVELCSNCVVIRDGAVSANLTGADLTTENLLYAATAEAGPASTPQTKGERA